jgi:uncharacterized damage-inducible protein DinB
MPEEFEGDLTGAVFWGANLTGAHFRDVDLTNTTITHACLANVDIDAIIDKLIINGVDVTVHVNERDPWYPLRAMIHETGLNDMAATWAALEGEWAKTIARAQALPDDALHQSVNDEWSFVQTLRHMVFAIDKWFTAPILGESFHPIGLPNKGSVGFPWPDLDQSLQPPASEALVAFANRSKKFRDFIASVTEADFTRSIEVLENGTNPLNMCLWVVFEEAFWHNRYAARDLSLLEAGT